MYVGGVFEVGCEEGTEVLEFINKGDVVLVLFPKDNVGGGALQLFLSLRLGGEEHCFCF